MGAGGIAQNQPDIFVPRPQTPSREITTQWQISESAEEGGVRIRTVGHTEARRQFHLGEEGLPEGGDTLTEEKRMKKGAPGRGRTEGAQR